MLQADHRMMKYFSTVLNQIPVKQQISIWFCFDSNRHLVEYFPISTDRNRFEH